MKKAKTFTKGREIPVFYERLCSCVPIVAQFFLFVNRFLIKKESNQPKKKNIFDGKEGNLPKKEKFAKKPKKGIDKSEVEVYNDGMKAKVSL